MTGCTPYSDDENAVEMKTADEIDAYYDYLGEMQEAGRE